MNKIHSIHDRTFKSAMADIKVAREFFEEYLPETIRSLADLETLKFHRDSYIDEDLRAFSSDILYQVKLRNNHTAYFYLLVEHQSSVDQLLAFRLWNYMMRVWSDHIKQTGEESLPLIFPMVFYHGKEPYDGHRCLQELIQAPMELVQEALFKPFHLIDTHVIQDEALRERKWAGILTYFFKHVYARDIWPFVQTIIELLKNIEHESGATLYAQLLLKYWLIAAETQKGPKAFIETIQEGLSMPIGGELMSMAEQLIQQGIQQGMQKGEGALLMRQLEHKFKMIPEVYRRRIEQANVEDLLNWGERVLDSQEIEDVFKA